ncbi:MAG: hypothetical protein WC447_00705 [Candidatus Paceibacterota bacterium]
MDNNIKNKQGGFLKLIILIVVILFLLSYFHVSVSQAIDWVINTIKSVF